MNCPVPGARDSVSNPASPEAFSGEKADFDFHLIEPAPVYRRVVDCKPIPQRPACAFAEAIHQRLACMRNSDYPSPDGWSSPGFRPGCSQHQALDALYVAIRRETPRLLFVNRIEDCNHGLLNDLVLQRRDPERPLPTVGSRDVNSPRWLRSAADFLMARLLEDVHAGRTAFAFTRQPVAKIRIRRL